MKYKYFFLVILSIHFFNLSPQFIIAQTELEILGKLANKLASIKKEIATEKQIWKEKEYLMVQEVFLLEKQKEQLIKKINEKEDILKKYEDQHNELTQNVEGHKKLINKQALIVDHSLTKLDEITKQVPRSLTNNLNADFGSSAINSDNNFNLKIKNLFNIYIELFKLSAKINYTQEIIAINSQISCEFDVIYVGLAQGYCVAKNNKYAGWARPSSDGWVWEWDQSLIPKVRKAVNMINNKQSFKLLELPLQIRKR